MAQVHCRSLPALHTCANWGGAGYLSDHFKRYLHPAQYFYHNSASGSGIVRRKYICHVEKKFI